MEHHDIITITTLWLDIDDIDKLSGEFTYFPSVGYWIFAAPSNGPGAS